MIVFQRFFYPLFCVTINSSQYALKVHSFIFLKLSSWHLSPLKHKKPHKKTQQKPKPKNTLKTVFLRRKSKAWWFPWKSSRQHLFIGCERSYRLSHTLEDISISTRGVSQLHFSRGSEISTIRCWLMWIVAYTSTHRSRGSRIRQWFLLPSHLPIYYKVTHVCHPCVSFLTNKPSGF